MELFTMVFLFFGVLFVLGIAIASYLAGDIGRDVFLFIMSFGAFSIVYIVSGLLWRS